MGFLFLVEFSEGFRKPSEGSFFQVTMVGVASRSESMSLFGVQNGRVREGNLPGLRCLFF